MYHNHIEVNTFFKSFHARGITIASRGPASGGVAASSRPLKLAIGDALLASAIALEAARHVKPVVHAEEARICGLLHGLGRMLVAFYLHGEYVDAQRLVNSGVAEPTAVAHVLGASYETLGLAVAKHWGLPEKFRHSMRQIDAETVSNPSGPDDWLRVVAAFGAHVVAALRGKTAQVRHKAMSGVFHRFGRALNLSKERCEQIVERALIEAKQNAEILGVAPQEPTADAALVTTAADQPLVGAPILAKTTAFPSAAAGHKPANSHELLASGLLDLTNALAEEASMADVLKLVVETIHRSLAFNHTLLLLLDANRHYVGKYGLGEDSGRLLRSFAISAKYAPDVFHAAIAHRVDVFVYDVDQPEIRDKIPAWYRGAVPHQSLLILPLHVRRQCVGLFYGGWKSPQAPDILSTTDLAQLRALRNHISLVCRPASRSRPADPASLTQQTRL